MIIMFRQIMVLTRKIFFPTNADPLHQSVITFRVWPGDLDSWIISLFVIPQILLMALKPSRAALIWKRRPTMYHHRYGLLETLSIMNYMFNCRGVLRIVMRERWRIVLGAMTVKYFHGLRLFQKFQVRTRVVFWDDTWFFYETTFEREGMVMCTAWRKALIRNWGGPVPAAEILEKLGVTGEPPPLEPEIEAMIEALAGP